MPNFSQAANSLFTLIVLFFTQPGLAATTGDAASDFYWSRPARLHATAPTIPGFPRLPQNIDIEKFMREYARPILLDAIANSLIEPYGAHLRGDVDHRIVLADPAKAFRQAFAILNPDASARAAAYAPSFIRPPLFTIGHKFVEPASVVAMMLMIASGPAMGEADLRFIEILKRQNNGPVLREFWRAAELGLKSPYPAVQYRTLLFLTRLDLQRALPMTLQNRFDAQIDLIEKLVRNERLAPMRTLAPARTCKSLFSSI